MRLPRCGGIFALLALTLAPFGTPPAARAQAATGPQWIWYPEGDPTVSAPAGDRYFRKTFTIQRAAAEVTLDITADDEYVVWVNGTRVGSGSDWKKVQSYEVTKLLSVGPNVVAVQARNVSASAGLLVRLNMAITGKPRLALVGDATWKASRTAPDGWLKADFDDSKWARAKVLGPVGTTGPWKGLAWASGVGDSRFTAPPGFRVERAVKPPAGDAKFSLVNMCFDAKGRLLVSRENGPILLCTRPDADGVCQEVRPYCTLVKNCQGMCWVRDALLLVGNGPAGTGLYRCRDTKATDQIDEATLLHKFKGGMGEHGPHAIVHGPDNWLYVVIGNHASAQPEKLAANSPLTRWPTGGMGPDQGKPGTTEDVLLPRLNDAHGHAADILAPGGTIWRLDHQGKNMSLVAAGFRNHFDAAFSPEGELFTFDSDMEWDENLPWYRAVRICHCQPGADFLWRTGAANTPNYYVDSLPPAAETGRGSPVGLEFYDHPAFPAKYRGTYFMADWSIGVIFAVQLERHGASYRAHFERFCTGSPMNVTDLAVGPDGSVYFTMGGRNTEGGVYRIVYGDKPAALPELPAVLPPKAALADLAVQPLSAWGRARLAKWLANPSVAAAIRERAAAADRPAMERVRALDLLQNHGHAPDAALLVPLAKDKDALVRAHAVWLLGVNGCYREMCDARLDGVRAELAKLREVVKDVRDEDFLAYLRRDCENLIRPCREALVADLADDDALVRRRCCEALIRSGVEPPVAALKPLLASDDIFLRTAARLVLQRIDPAKWATALVADANARVANEAIIALCKTNRAAPHAEAIFSRLRGKPNTGDPTALLDWVRTLQLAMVHTARRPIWVSAIAEQCVALFPQKDWRVNRELAIVLTQLRREGHTTEPVHAKLLAAMKAGGDDRMQQIHYFYCLRLLHQGWTPEQKSELLAWYDATKTWTGGHSFTPFLENVLRDLNGVFTAEDRAAALSQSTTHPLAAAAMVRFATDAKQLPPATALYAAYTAATRPGAAYGKELRAAIVAALVRDPSRLAAAALRQIADRDPSQLPAVARALGRKPGAEDLPVLFRGLEAATGPLASELIDALLAAAVAPKPDDPAGYRAVLLASGKLPDARRWKAVELLRKWTKGKQFGADKGEWKPELTAWAVWYGQAFPKAAKLPDVTADKPTPSKYKYEELLALIEPPPKGLKGDAERGRVVFTKAQCVKCHKYGSEGEGVGPDLTDLSKRFKRADTLESIVYPSKVISDQYRSTLIRTTKGQTILGLAGTQGDVVNVVMQDGSKITLRKDEIEEQFASLVSVMPEKLLDELTRQEIADLFAYLESGPPKK